MVYQLRVYTVKPGEMSEWLEEWSTRIAPLRRRFGFEVLGAWTVDGSDRFIWILGYRGSKSWQEADSAYYASAERAAITPDPARHLEATEQWPLTAVQDQ